MGVANMEMLKTKHTMTNKQVINALAWLEERLEYYMSGQEKEAVAIAIEVFNTVEKLDIPIHKNHNEDNKFVCGEDREYLE